MSIKQTLTVVTINYNSTEKLIKMVKSLDLIDSYIREIIVIDNSPNHQNISFKNSKVKIIKNKINVGFAKAANQGINESSTDTILLINPDCELIDDSPIKSLDKIRKNKDIGVIGGSLIDSSTGKTKPTATSKPTFLTGLFEFTNLKRIFPHNIYTRRFWVETAREITEATQVHSVCGAYMFIKKTEHLRFPEEYFLYLEDVDFGNVTEKCGLKTYFDPESKISHIGGYSSKSKYRIVLKHWYESRKIYFSKNLNTLQGNILYLVFTIEEKLLFLYHYLTNTPNE